MGNRRIEWMASFGGCIIIVLSFLFIDLPVAHFCHALNQEIRDIFEWITKMGESTYYLIASFALYAFFRWQYRHPLYAYRSLLFFMNIALSGIAVNIIKVLAGRLRPKMFFEKGMYGFDPFHIGYEFNSFPSGHVTTVFAIAATCSIFWPKYRALYVTAAVIVALSRLALSAHYFSDIIAGAYIGTLTAIVMKAYLPVQSKLWQT